MTTSIDWAKVFKTTYPAAGVSESALSEALATLFAPLSDEELGVIASSQTNPFPPSDPLYGQYRPFDASQWQLPSKPLPPSYLAFLHWSNGGSFFNDDRHFDPFLACQELRQYMLGYHIPQYLPNAFPFALNGSGYVYLFDMRQEPVEGEYPVLFTNLGNLRYEQSKEIDTSFVGVCSGTTNPQDEM
jgi:hypothetical protein